MRAFPLLYRGRDRSPPAHVHFEVNLILSHDFEQWHKLVFPTEVNRHGLYNGINLAGMDAAGCSSRRISRPG
jgi:hypothetical protein